VTTVYINVQSRTVYSSTYYCVDRHNSNARPKSVELDRPLDKNATITKFY